MMAIGPPYRRKTRKMAASEKLIANVERGSVRLMRGARNTAKKRIAERPQSSREWARAGMASARETAAARMSIPFAIFERVSRFIDWGASGSARANVGEVENRRAQVPSTLGV